MFQTPVSRYMTPDPRTVDPTASLEEVADALASRSISAMPVVDGRRPVGVISRHDLLRVGGLQGESGRRRWVLPDKTVADVMSHRIHLVDDVTSIREAAALMLDQHVHRVFVERDRALVGVLTTRDVMQAIVDERLQAPIHRYMSSPVRTIGAYDTVGEARDRLTSLGVRGLVVAENGWPVGIFDEEDALASRHEDPRIAVERVMGHEVLIQGPDVRVNRAAARMAAMHVRRIVVIEGAEMQGILTGFDLAGAAALA